MSYKCIDPPSSNDQPCFAKMLLAWTETKDTGKKKLSVCPRIAINLLGFYGCPNIALALNLGCMLQSCQISTQAVSLWQNLMRWILYSLSFFNVSYSWALIKHLYSLPLMVYDWTLALHVQNAFIRQSVFIWECRRYPMSRLQNLCLRELHL